MHKKINTFLKNNILVIAFILLGVIAFLNSKTPTSKEANPPEPPLEKSVDTFIPRGFVLVPLEISNADSLASMVGEGGGVVDLYLATTEKQKGSRKVGTRLKILKAPLNPQQYAVLVPESESSRLLSYAGPFVAVIQNPQARGTEITTTSAPRIQVDYQNE